MKFLHAVRDRWRGYSDADMAFTRAGGIPNSPGEWAALASRRSKT